MITENLTQSLKKPQPVKRRLLTFCLWHVLNPAVFHDQHAVGKPLGLLTVMVRHDHGGAAFLLLCVHYRFDDLGVFLVYGRRRFVEKKYLGLDNEGPGDPEPLCLAARKGQRVLLFFMLEADEGEG